MKPVQFFTENKQLLADSDTGSLLLLPRLIAADEAKAFFNRLRQEICWRQDQITLAGRQIAIPRLQAWHGDSNAHYRYSGLSLSPSPWTRTLLQIKRTVEICSDASFNSVLLNLYRDGCDSMGWHSDNEPELGEQPLIASLSLGASRQFCLREKKPDGNKLKLVLDSGSLLLMSGRLQENWQHQVPKTRQPVGERINLTFRWIHY